MQWLTYFQHTYIHIYIHSLLQENSKLSISMRAWCVISIFLYRRITKGAETHCSNCLIRERKKEMVIQHWAQWEECSIAIRTYTYTYTYIYIYIYYIHTYLHTYIHTYLLTYYLLTYIYTYIYTYAIARKFKIINIYESLMRYFHFPIDELQKEMKRIALIVWFVKGKRKW